MSGGISDPTVPRSADRLVWVLPIACAAYAVAAGRDANWDLLNYHYYNVHAWLSGRDEDLALAQLQTWFNPLLHLPLYLGMEHLPPRLYAALLGGVQGLNLVLVWRLARTAWTAPGMAVLGPALVTMTAACGAGFLAQLGTSFGDTLVSLPLLGALLLIVRAARAPSPGAWSWPIAAAGFLGGLAVGLKPLVGLYAIGLAAGTVALPGTARARQLRGAALAAGGIAGAATAGGWWYWHVAELTGNPLFPYYNDIFQSRLYWNERFVFSYFLPKNAVEAVLYPWIWLADSTRVSEVRFVDLTIPALMTLILVAGAARVLGLKPLGNTAVQPAIRALAAFWSVAYLLWLTQSAVYRFAVVLEMTAPLLIVATLVRWVPASGLRVRVIAILVPVMLVTWPANFGRYPFADRYVATTPIDLVPGTMILVAGWAPLSYMVGSFPPGTPLVRLQSNMHGFVDRPNGMDRLVRERVNAHAGPLVLLMAAAEWPIAQPLLDHEGYRVDRAACRDVDGAIEGGGGAGLLNLCEVMVSRPETKTTEVR